MTKRPLDPWGQPIPTMTEAQLQRSVWHAAVLAGWKVYHAKYSIGSVKGWPDLALFRPPRMIFAELKSDTGKLTAAQPEWLDLLDQYPWAETYLWRPDDLDDIYACLLLEQAPPKAESPPWR